MKNLFNSIKLDRPKNNVFDLSHDVKLSCNMGQLVPVLCMEAVPGDKFNISCESLIRFAPLIAPVMHRMDVTMHYYFVPNRILWPNWENFITQTKVGPSVPAFPTVAMYTGTYTPLADYLGIPKPPPETGYPGESVSALPFAAYQSVYNSYYRDENLVLESDVKHVVDDGENLGFGLINMRTRAWEKDYFTASLPFAQKGAAVDIPLGDVQLNPDAMGQHGYFRDANDQATGLAGTAIGDLADPGKLTVGDPSDVPPRIAGVYDPNGTLETEPTTINDLRRAFKLQEWLERNARGGTRYIENILAHFGVKSSDARLQRPEYITGTKSPVMISEVLNTTGTDDLPQANMAGHGVSVTSGKYGNYRCEEHGYIIGVMSIMPKPAYQQGIPKHFLKTVDAFQYYWPSFAHIGEQEVENKEIYAFQGAAGSDTFGYVPRYAEYKFMPSRVAGDFRTTLDFWHLGRIFATPPALNQTFIECNPDPRVFAVTDPDVQKMYCHVLNKIRAVRPMPFFGNPQF